MPNFRRSFPGNYMPQPIDSEHRRCEPYGIVHVLRCARNILTIKPEQVYFYGVKKIIGTEQVKQSTLWAYKKYIIICYAEIKK